MILMESISWVTLHNLQHHCSESNFWEAITVWNKSPNLASKRIFGVKLFDYGGFDTLNLVDEILEDILKEINKIEICKYFEGKLKNVNNEEKLRSTSFRYRIFSKIILYKRENPNNLEIAIFDKNEKSAVFLEPSTNNLLCFQFKDNELLLKIPSDSPRRKELDWHGHVLLPKLVKWMQNYSGKHNASISLVSIDEYKSLYFALKKKYCFNIKQIWTEVTDPDKFIHEDIAIATYILLLWKDKSPRRFVDLGCGNGLLVHILNGEGHLGIGYDLRARKIWSKYPQDTVLKVMQIKPSKEQVFPEADWIIGNHSDELIPWIPVIATFSSPATDFFLLPCCAYNFDGSKFQRNNSSKSLYNDYLDYVEQICIVCGFNISRDRLRIPSTKRICFVSSGRNHDVSLMTNVKSSVDNFIKNSSIKRKDSDSNCWSINVKLRDSKEKVRNCTQLDHNLKMSIVNLISLILLKDSCSDCLWNEGTPTKIGELIHGLPSDYLVKLKNEGKGLQTFIKNHHFIFKLCNGFVNFRKPIYCPDVKSDNWKSKPCWFFENHPNSCPLDDDKCSYIHVKR